ncbi:MAG TPA: aldehyde dehydrogenase family protein [Victivallales bacterium]|nr:aldehyde dehydrogenase family protein [Victivallales bacterium]
MTFDSIKQKVDNLLSNALESAAVFSQLDQKQTDKIVKAVYKAAFKNRVKLAKMAAEETGLGKWEDKVIKNVVGSHFVHEDIKDQKTVGIISDNKETGIMEVAQPLGPILAIIPVTNPTSTTIFKILIALKSRNPVIISPHQKAIGCIAETARICYEAALKEDAPENCIQWTLEEAYDHATFDIKKHFAETTAIMTHRDLAVIVATGGGGVVKAAYTSGTPAYGVGSGNVPVFIDKSADIPFAVNQIFISKTFDNGTICASEQAIIVEEVIGDKVKEEFEKHGGYFLNESEVNAVEAIALDKERNVMSADVVGQSAQKIAKMAGISVPEDVRILMAPLDSVGDEHPLSSEILCPILAYYVKKDFSEAIATCMDLNYHGGMGHSASIHANDESAIREFAKQMNAGRILVNSPSSQGAVDGIFNKLHTSLTLGCGTTGKNITTDNITVKHLINIQRVARRRVDERFSNFDASLFYDESLSTKEFEKKYNLNY